MGMRRTSIMLPDDLKVRVLSCANQEGLSLGAFIREALILKIRPPAATGQTDPFFADTAVFRGKAPRDLARHHDRYLYGDQVA